MIGKKNLVVLHIPSELTDGGHLLGCRIGKMSLGGVWGSGAAYGFVQGAGVTSFIPLVVVGHTSWAGVHLLGQRHVGQNHVDLDLTLCFAIFLRK